MLFGIFAGLSILYLSYDTFISSSNKTVGVIFYSIVIVSILILLFFIFKILLKTNNDSNGVEIDYLPFKNKYVVYTEVNPYIINQVKSLFNSEICEKLLYLIPDNLLLSSSGDCIIFDFSDEQLGSANCRQFIEYCTDVVAIFDS